MPLVLAIAGPLASFYVDAHSTVYRFSMDDIELCPSAPTVSFHAAKSSLPFIGNKSIEILYMPDLLVNIHMAHL